MAAAGGAPGTGGDDVALDPDMLKLLAADSRRDILRFLRQRRMTLSELAAALGLGKPTVLEHLRRLDDAGLVRRCEDERLWVYYELTPQGQRVATPGRARFYLIMGLAAAAALVFGGAVVGGLLLAGPAELPAELVYETDHVAGEPIRLLVATDATLVEARLLGANGNEVALRIDGTTLSAPTGVPAGHYALRLVDEQGRETRLDVQVRDYLVQGPRVLWAGVQPSATFTLLRDGMPVDGALHLGPLVGVPVVDGSARIDGERLGTLPDAGRYSLAFAPAQAKRPVDLPFEVEVREPQPSFLPPALVEHSNATLEVVLAPYGAALPEGEVPLTVNGEPVATTREGIRMRAHLGPIEPGALAVRVGWLPEQEVPVLRDVRMNLTTTSEGFALLVAGARGAPVEGASVLLDGALVATSDASGRAPFDSAFNGTRVLEVKDPQGDPLAQHVLRFDGSRVELVPPRVKVSMADSGVVTVVNHDAIAHRLFVTATLGERPVSARYVEAAPSQEVQVSLGPLPPGAKVNAEAAPGVAWVLFDERLGAPESRPMALDVTATEAPTPATPMPTAPTLEPPHAGRGMTPTAPSVPGPTPLLVVAALALALLLRRRHA